MPSTSQHSVGTHSAHLLLVCCALWVPIPSRAQTATAPDPPVVLAKPEPLAYSANRGHWIFGAQVGFSMEYGLNPHEVSHIQLLVAQPQLAYIVRDFRGSFVHRFEIMDEGIFGSAVHPTPAYLAGTALIFRFEGGGHGRWEPFFDAGAGVQRTPLFQHTSEVNGFTQFTPQVGIGVEYFVQPQRALVFEWRSVHMSNAGLVPPNMGFDSSMLTIGFRWLRRPVGAGEKR